MRCSRILSAALPREAEVMSPTISELTVAGRKVAMLRAGPGSGEAVLLVHGGRTGVSPIAGGSHLWSPAIPYLSYRPLFAIDLPGAGGSELGSPASLAVDAIGQHLLAVLDAIALPSVHFVGHDLGGLVGLSLAVSAPEKLRSLSLVASGVSAPTGDGLDDIVFDAAPLPRWSRHSQQWAFERVCYSHAHIDEALLAACVAAAAGRPHRDAAAALADDAARVRNFAIGAAKGRIWAALRGDGLAVPTQLVWSSHDPLAAPAAGYVLFKTIAAKQRATQFHLINRAGAYPFREQPAEFARLVAAFQDAAAV
jgi:pimeloyl-ACP methyl ester carboxylesterase